GTVPDGLSRCGGRGSGGDCFSRRCGRGTGADCLARRGPSCWDVPTLSGRAERSCRSGAMSYTMQLYAVLAKDLLVERRTKDALSAMLMFSLLVLVTFNFALDLRAEIMTAVGPGVLWTAVLLGSTLGLGRTFAMEREQGTLDGLLMAPVDRSALYLAKLLGNVALMAVVLLVSVPAYAALFDVPLNPGPLFITLVLGTV